MAQLDRETLKEFFEAGDFPTEAQFADFIDSVLNFIDDGNVVFLTGDQTIAGDKSFTEGITVDQALSYLAANGVKFGDGDTALYESADGTLNIYIEGAIRWALTTAHLTANIVGGVDLVRVAATATDPCYAFLSDSNTGLGRAGSGQLSLIAAGVEGARVTENQLTTNGQAHGGNNTKTFSASATFDANDGNNQKMVTTANTTIALSNELPGTYIIKLLISGTVTAITVGASIGTKLPNASLDFDYTDGAVNLVTIIVDADGVKDYTITN